MHPATCESNEGDQFTLGLRRVLAPNEKLTVMLRWHGGAGSLFVDNAPLSYVALERAQDRTGHVTPPIYFEA